MERKRKCKIVRKFLLINKYSTDWYGRIFHQYESGFARQIGYTEHIEDKSLEKYINEDADGYERVDKYRKNDNEKSRLLGVFCLHPNLNRRNWFWVVYDVYENERNPEDKLWFVMMQSDYYNIPFVYDGKSTLGELSETARKIVEKMEGKNDGYGTVGCSC